MPNEIVMPRLGWTMEVGTVVEWLKASGDPVEAGEHIFAVESDKAITEVESLDSGVLYIPDATPIGVEVPVGAALAFILEPGEEPPAYSFGGQALPEPQDFGKSIDDDIPTDPGPVAASNGAHGGVMPVSPRARRVAAELGVDLDSVTGSGKGGRIREQDVRAAAAAIPAPAPEPRATPSVRKLAEQIGVDLRTVPSSRPSGRVTRADLTRGASATSAPVAEGTTAPISPIRRAIRDRMSETARTVAPVTLTTEADATELWDFRQRLKQDLQTPDSGLRAPSITDLLVRISALALVDQPELNVRLDGDTITQFDAAHIGIAVDTERGLLAPVLRDADRKSIHDIAAESAELIARTRDGSIGADQLKGSTFTVTNLGMFEIDAFTPILNLPEAAILGVGRIVPKPVVVDVDTEEIAIRRMLFLSLTFDHRVVDGAPAARFLQRIKQMVEHPLVALTR